MCLLLIVYVQDLCLVGCARLVLLAESIVRTFRASITNNSSISIALSLPLRSPVDEVAKTGRLLRLVLLLLGGGITAET